MVVFFAVAACALAVVGARFLAAGTVIAQTLGHQRLFVLLVGCPDFLVRDTVGASEQFRLMAPARNGIVHFGKGRAGPAGGVHPIVTKCMA